MNEAKTDTLSRAETVPDRVARNAMLAAMRRGRDCFLYFVRCVDFLKVGISSSPSSL